MWSVQKKKSVVLTGRGAIARLGRTVRALRYYMEMLQSASGIKENGWHKLLNKVVWTHNHSSHQLSDLPQYLVCSPGDKMIIGRYSTMPT